MRVKLTVLCFITFVLFINIGSGQSATGTVSGIVLDPSGGVIAGAVVLIINDATGVQYPGKANSEGYYVVPNISPGTYRIQVSNSGFKTIIKPDIVIHVEDALAINFTLPIGAASEIVTVESGTPLINTENASVSTVVDRTYVANMPLNGRSFQDLILLAPGVLTNSPQNGAVIGQTGEFSVNGQRTESNYYVVDGVSANVGVYSSAANVPNGPSGSLPISTSLGTTQGLVSVDALEEFRVQTSTYSAEYGRSPGGQFSFVTRSGTNEWHGTAFDYLRNDFFDANDWFNNYFDKPEPPLRQNDFGGTLGGPIEIPRLYNGKDKTFFFFSYEGLRLIQPQAATISFVPDANLRANTPAPLNLVMNAAPVPNGPSLGNGLAEFIGTWSNPSSIDAVSIRLDQDVNQRLRFFFRFADTPSISDTREGGNAFNPSAMASEGFTARTYTLGATSSFSTSVSNEFRLNYSSNFALFARALDNFGGATPVDLLKLQGLSSDGNPSPQVAVVLLFGSDVDAINSSKSSGAQRQWNVLDTIGLSIGRHRLKFGIDFRRLHPAIYQNSPVAEYLYFSDASVLANSVDFGFGRSYGPAFPLYTNFSAFAQDEWKLTPRLNLSMGLRWEVDPAPGAPTGNLPYTVQGSSLSTLALAPQGIPLWETTWFNFAPRLGIAYVMRDDPHFETVVRGGGGVFFDTGQQLGSLGYGGPGFLAANNFGTLVGSPASFPASAAEVTPTIVNPPVPPYTAAAVLPVAYPVHLQLPYTLQWNASVAQALGASQALTVSYVGSSGRRLLKENTVQNAASFNPNFGAITFVGNGLTSDYNALQVQFQRRIAHGLQALASYTWSHCLDFGSENFSLPYQRGNCDFDVRNNISSAFSYDVPNVFHGGFAGAVLQHWGLDDRFTARTGFPVFLEGISVVDPVTAQTYYSGLNLIPGQPVYIYGSECAAVYNNGMGCPGGRAINPNAFALPTGCTVSSCLPGTAVGDAPRNFARGFGAWQMDLAIRREFPIHERLKLQFRAEAFNIFNHPNFGMINPTYCAPGPGCTFGQATATLATSLGGLSSLYQMGGSRSMQFALKVMF